MSMLRRRAIAMVTALWWVAGTSTLLLMGFQWARQQAHLERKIFQASSHLYLAEGVIAREVSRLKARPWLTRWYMDPTRSQLHGAPLAGTFADCDYTGWVQDVADFWNDRPREALPDHVDLFLKVTYPRTGPSSALHFFARIVMRTPTPERPTPFTMRRLVRVPDFDPADPAARAIVLARMERGERAREWNRAESNVYARVLNAMANEGVPLDVVAERLAKPDPRPERDDDPVALFASAAHAGPAYPGAATQEQRRESERPQFSKDDSEARWRESSGLTLREISTHLASPHISAEIALERQLMTFLRRGQRTLTDPTFKPAARGRYESAVDDFRAALNVAYQQDVHNAPWTQPMAGYLAAKAEWSLARTYPSADGSRDALLDSARTRLQKCIDNFKFDRVRVPTRFEAPYSYLLQARVAATRGRFGEAVARVDEWRRRYGAFMPWNEDATVGNASGLQTTPADEVAYWQMQQLAQPPLLLVLFRGNTGSGGEFPNNTIFGWQRGLSRYAEQGRMDERRGREGFGTVFVPAHAVQVRPKPGAVMGGQLVFSQAAKGTGAQLYDTWTNTWRTLPYDPIYDTSFDGPFVSLADGRVLCVSWQRAQVLDLESERVTEVAPPARDRTSHKLVTLPDGKVLSVGGGKQRDASFRWEDDTGEVFDPGTMAWTSVRNKMSEKRDGCTATLLDDGRVLITGGWVSRVGPFSQWKCSSTAELYLPDQNVFWPGDAMPPDVTLPPDLAGRRSIPLNVARYNHWAVKLDSGDVLIGGGTNTAGMRDEVELFSPATMGFTFRGRAPCQGNGIGAAKLHDGTVIVAGGSNESGGMGNRAMSSAVGRYDPASGRWTAMTPLPTGYAYGVALQVMPD